MNKKFLHPSKDCRVGPTSLDQQNSNSNMRRSAGSPIASEPNSSPPPELMPYDTFEKKSVQQLLYEVYSKNVLFSLQFNLKCIFND